jgi:hypothetical protein
MQIVMPVVRECYFFIDEFCIDVLKLISLVIARYLRPVLMDGTQR